MKIICFPRFFALACGVSRERLVVLWLLVYSRNVASAVSAHTPHTRVDSSSTVGVMCMSVASCRLAY